MRHRAQYYNQSVDQDHGRLDRHQLEFDLTCRSLDRYLPPGGAVLEIGAATGRYTVALARHGYRVTAVDLSPALLDACRRNLVAAGLADRVWPSPTRAPSMG